MKKLALFLVLFGAAFAAFALESKTMADATDFILVGIAAFLLAGVAYFLIFAIWGIARLIRHWRGDEIREDGFLVHGGFKSELIPWEQVESLEIRMVEPGPQFKKYSVRYSKIKVPALFMHRADGGKEVEIVFLKMLKMIADIQGLLRKKGTHYTQRDIDWVERWRAVDTWEQFKEERKRRAESIAEDDVMPPNVDEKLKELQAAGMSEKDALKEYFRMMEERKGS